MSDTIIPQTFSRYPLLWLAVYFTCGIIFARCAEISFLAFLAAPPLLGTLCIAYRRSSVIALPLIFLSLGALCYEVERERATDNRIKRIYDEGRILSGEPVEVEGVLSNDPEPAFGGLYLKLRSEKLRFKGLEREVSGNVRLFMLLQGDPSSSDLDPQKLRYGSRLRVYCRLEREERFQNPGLASRIQTLDQQEIDATAIVKSQMLIEKQGEDPVFIPLAWVYAQRQRLILEFEKNFSAPTAGVMIASLLGDQNFLDRQTSEVFRDGGTFHMLVISGLHITFIGGLTVLLVSYFSRRQILRFILPMMFLWAYTFAVGAEVPVVRASVMFTIVLFSRVVYREASQLNALGFCCLLVLLWRPDDLFSASFQLTVVSVSAIVGCSFPLVAKLRAIGTWTPDAARPLPPNVPKRLRSFCELLYWNDESWNIENKRQIWSAKLYKTQHPRWLRSPNLKTIFAYIFEGVTVSIIVQVWMLPLLVIYFHRVSPVSVLLNLWVGLFLALESFCSLLAVMIGTGNEWLAVPLRLLTEVFNELMLLLPVWFSDNRLASFRLPTYPGWMKVIYPVFGVSVLCTSVAAFRWRPFDLIRTTKIGRWSAVAGLLATTVLSAVIIFHPFSTPNPDGRLTVNFLDVGQGDSALITFPNGVTMLVDGGGQVDYRGDDAEFEPDRQRIGEAVVSEFLWEKGYSRIDYLLATHADADHIQGLSDVARNFDIGTVLLGTTPLEDPDFSEFMRVVDSRKIAFATVKRGDDLEIGGSGIKIMNPPAEGSAHTSANNSSIVMKITYGDRSFLFTGDIERDVEAGLIIGGDDLRADVVKVPHHGSRTSSTDAFIDRIRAGTAVISVGRRSRFGHPHAEVVSRWRDSGAAVMTTGEKGTISVSTNGQDLRTGTFVY